MDPETCIRNAFDHYEGGESAEALHCLKSYFDWRLNGGFQGFAPNDANAIELLETIAISLESMDE